MDQSEIVRQELLGVASSHLLSAQDEIVLVLKAHLVAESFLYEILYDQLPNAAALDNSRLSFSQLLSIVESLRPSKREQWIWLSFRHLNSLRNEYAHELSPDRLDGKRKLFIKSTKPWIFPPSEQEGLLQFKFILLILCAQLANIRHGNETAGPIT
jgi:hypothetical protein